MKITSPPAPGEKILPRPGESVELGQTEFVVKKDGPPWNMYPCNIIRPVNCTISGGVFRGIIRDLPWGQQYRTGPNGNGNSAALRVESGSNVTVRGQRLFQPWDGVRLTGDGPYRIERVHIRQAYDDAFELDGVPDGAMRDVLVEDSYVGISLDHGAGDMNQDAGQALHLQNVAISLAQFQHEDPDRTEGAPFKLDINGAYKISMLDCVFSFTHPLSDMMRTRMPRLRSYLTDGSRDNWLLYRGAGRFPVRLLQDFRALEDRGFKFADGEEAHRIWRSKADKLRAMLGETVTPSPPPDPPKPPPPLGPDLEEARRLLSTAAEAIDKAKEVLKP